MRAILKPEKSGFTLLELLVVIAVMALLLALTVPSFQGLGRGSRAKTAIIQLNAVMNLARQRAITTRQDVYIVFPDVDVDYTSNTASYAYTSFAVYGSRDGFMSEWRKLPAGIVFHDSFKPSADKIASEPFNVFLQSNTNYIKQIPFPDRNSVSQPMMALTFRADGALATAGFYRKSVFLTEGWLTSDSSGPLPNFRSGSTIYGLEIRPETGQTRIREYNL